MAARTKIKIAPEIETILRNAEVGGPNNTHLKITQKLDPKTYKSCAKILEALGGKWNRTAQATVFDKPIAEVLADALDDGEVTNKKNLFQSFYTPDFAADLLVRHADLQPGNTVLEPEAGEGALINAIDRSGVKIAHLIAMEINPEAVLKIKKTKFTHAVISRDFLETKPSENTMVDRIVMNPPFSNGQDAAHIWHALKHLKPGGVLVAIVPVSFNQKDTGDYKRITDLCQSDKCENFGCFDLPKETFKESGTLIDTCIFKFIKAKDA